MTPINPEPRCADAIVDEIRRSREAHAATLPFDLRAIYRDLKQQEQASRRTFVSSSLRRVQLSLKARPSPEAEADCGRS
jgi:hypothetical protein